MRVLKVWLLLRANLESNGHPATNLFAHFCAHDDHCVRRFLAYVLWSSLTGTTDFIVPIHIHGAMMVLWLFLLIAQTTFAATGNSSLHTKLGPWMIRTVPNLVAIFK